MTVAIASAIATATSPPDTAQTFGSLDPDVRVTLESVTCRGASVVVGAAVVEGPMRRSCVVVIGGTVASDDAPVEPW